MDQIAPVDLLHLSISHAGRSVDLALPPSTPASTLTEQLTAQFNVDPSAQKVLAKGRKLDLLSSPSTPLSALLGAGLKHKLLLIGAPSQALASLKAHEALREAKHRAFEHHASRPQFKVSRTGVHGVDESANYKFHEIRPFPEEVPSYEKRVKMLERLAEDPAVREVMRRHKFVVGVLTELHPLLQPELLGLNKNAGQEISLRLLTNDLSGTRAYLDVRKVLLHELTHNHISPHDDSFKKLNSELNAEVVEYERLAGEGPSLGLGAAAAEKAWEPEQSQELEEERKGRTLNEVREEREWDKLRYGREDEVEERRERVRRAAEARQRQA